VAPTILEEFGLKPPPQMKGHNVFETRVAQGNPMRKE